MYKYQVIKLTKSAPGGSIVLLEAPDTTIAIPQYKNIHSFAFYVAVDPSKTGTEQQKVVSAVNLMEINEFKISNYEIVGPQTPFKIFATGSSAKFNQRFTEVNIPNSNQAIKLSISQVVCGGTAAQYTGDVYLILRLNNTTTEHFNGYCRYETHKMRLTNTVSTNTDRIKIRTKSGAKTLIGVYPVFSFPFFAFEDFVTPGNRFEYGRIGNQSKSSIAKLALNLNNKQSNPITLSITDYVWNDVARVVEPINLNEPILPGTDITGYVLQSGDVPGATDRLNFYLTLKYKL